MQHPMYYQHRQMNGLFDNIIGDIKEAAKKAEEKLKTQALANVANTFFSDQRVQQAIVDTGKENAAQSLANSIVDSMNATQAYVAANRQRLMTYALVAGVGAVVLFAVLKMRKA